MWTPNNDQICDPKFDIKTKIRQIFGELPRKILIVQFEEGWTLSFITTDSGGFELMTLPGGKQMMFQDKKYTCVYGGSGNSLVVDGDYFYDFYMNFRDPDGNVFKDYHPKHWR